jgi:hypothetical protein
MVFCEAFVPSARRLFRKPQRFPIADVHYAMGFDLLARVFEQEHYYQPAASQLFRSPCFLLYRNAKN